MTNIETAILVHDLIDKFSIIIRNGSVFLTEFEILELASKLALATIDTLRNEK